MSDLISDRMTRAPLAFDEDRAVDTLAVLPEVDKNLIDLIKGAAGSSPFLADTMRREADWLARALTLSPEAALTNLLNADVDDVSRDLRRMKARSAVLIALADLGGVWSGAEVTDALTRTADRAVDVALKSAMADIVRRDKLPGQGESDIATGCGLSVIAMGKMGAGELNYSSDIDLICLYDETRFEPDDYGAARTAFVSAVRTMCKTLSARTADGYVFRTDLRLRPDASVTPVAISMEAAERYYESFGRTWERAAYIKARAAAGDISAGERFLKTLTPFVWRRHLDFAAIQDAQDMRLRIRDHKGLIAAPSHLGHDVKLGEGGIREIEFFTQTRQLISGGRDPDLRHSRTDSALAALSQKNWATAETTEQLTDDYWAHRELEHRLQMIGDQQTHVLPDSDDDFARVAALAGREPGAYANEIVERFKRVSTLTETFFDPSASKAPEETSSGAFPAAWLAYPALRSPRATQILKRVWPRLADRFAQARNPEEALSHFDSFLKGLPAGVQVFSLFEANQHLLELIVDVIDTAPELALYLSRNSGVFDAMIGGDFFADWPGQAALQSQLSAALVAESDFEKMLDRARVWAREWHFRIGVHLLRGVTDAEQAGRQYADLAEAVLAAIWPEVQNEFARKHGPPPGRGAALLAMGSLGAGWQTAASDLDLIVIFDARGAEQSDGPRPLVTRPYFARLTQALVTALSAPTAEGRLYQVDMRLRPSGRQGPVATSLAAFKSYQTDEAWTWEHLALTRARPVAGDATLMADIEDFRQALLRQKRDRSQVLGDVYDMRARLSDAKQASSWLDVRAGDGGLQDIELLCQTAALLDGNVASDLDGQRHSLENVFAGGADAAHKLAKAARLFRQLRATCHLAFGETPEDNPGAGAASLLLRETGLPDMRSLEAEIAKARKDVETIVTGALSG